MNLKLKMNAKLLELAQPQRSGCQDTGVRFQVANVLVAPRHGLRGPVQGVQRKGAGRNAKTVGEKMFRELARAARAT